VREGKERKERRKGNEPLAMCRLSLVYDFQSVRQVFVKKKRGGNQRKGKKEKGRGKEKRS